LKGKLRENVEQYAQQGMVSKMLATIILDVPVEVSDDDLLLSEPDREKLSALFAELEFRSLGRRILGDAFSVNRNTPTPAASRALPPKSPSAQMDLFAIPASADGASREEMPEVERGKTIDNTPHEYIVVQGKEALQALVKTLSAGTSFCFDTETSSLDYFEASLVGLSFSTEAHKGWYVPCPDSREATLELLDVLRPLFESTQHEKIGQNVKFDLLMLQQYGIKVALPVYDTMLAHYLIEPDQKHGMDYLSETYLGYTPVSIETLIGKKGKNQGSMRDVPLEQIKEYAAEDADITWQLKQVLDPMVKQREVDSVLHDIELPLIPVLAAMESEGVKLDEPFLRQYSEVLNTDLIRLREEIFAGCGMEFNLDSPKQLGEVLFEKMGLPGGEKTKTGQYSTNEEVLSKLEKEHTVIGKILDYREITKLRSTYVEALPALIQPRTGRVHTTFNQTIAATGRLSSVSPNLQNIPIRTERGQQIRKAFIARDAEHVILSADYSQIELRLVAELAKEEAMLEAFRSGVDIHQATAAKVYGVALDEVSREMRSKAKMVNFGIIYSISAFGLSQRLGVPRKEAAELIENYLTQYPGIKAYMNQTLEFARANGYVKTMMGRRRYLKDINSRNFTIRGFAEREAINAPVQGSAADLIKMAMIRIHAEMQQRGMKSRMTLQVHDELVFDAHVSELDTLKALVTDIMQTAFKTEVPIVVETGVGANWLEAH
jgi:DNA polymerase-1